MIALRRGILLGCALAAACGALYLLRTSEKEPVAPEMVVPKEPETPRRQGIDRPVTSAPEPGMTAGNAPHPDTLSFGTDVFAPEREAEVLLRFFAIFRERFGGFPAAEDNRGMMHALAGANPEGLVIFPADHPRIDSARGLLDGWGNPFHFHMISRDHLEIRSAGPDGELFTDDDLLAPRREALRFGPRTSVTN
jgi:hypothetical protein